MACVARGAQNGRKIGTKRNRNRDLDVVFGCRFAACCTLRFFFSTRNACWRGGLRGKDCELTGWNEREGSLGQVRRIELEDHTLTTAVRF